MRHDYITRIIQVCLDIANIADEKGEQGEFVLPELGLGYRALSGILRRGCKDIIDLQGKYHAAIEVLSLGILIGFTAAPLVWWAVIRRLE